MKRFLFILTSFFISTTLLAEHITGGEIFYTYKGLDAAGNHQYEVTLKLFRNCGNVGAQLDANAAIAIFDNTNNALVLNSSIAMTRKEELQLTTPGPCIVNAPTVCYEVGYYVFTVSLPSSLNGYTVAYQRCCRINGINNLSGSGNIGATFTASIPGTSMQPTGPENNSAKFTATDTVIVCGGYPFTYSFAAVDPDQNDILRYSFCNAYPGATTMAPMPNPPSSPPYSSVSYSSGFSASSPLGPNVTINSVTGLISGTSPAEGIYVVTVCVSEIRNGIVIATQRKDLQIKAGGCDIAKPQLNPEYITCDGLSYSFTHPSNSIIRTFYWEFGDPASGANNISTDQNPSHDFSAPGDYTIKLVTNRNGDCSDSTTAIMRVWPGFFPDFSSIGVCLTNPVAFHDNTQTNFGVVNSWRWNFADETTLADTSHMQHPGWTYATAGTKSVELIVSNSKGCTKTITKDIAIMDKPPITLAFKDTLICRPDAVQLQASGTGNFTWSPLTNILNANSGTPTVNPTTTTMYHVQLNEQGCINNDSVRVRVVDFVTLNKMGDTLICETDSIQLRISSDGLRYEWTPVTSVNDATIQNPMATAGNTTTYTVTARIGSCSNTKSIVVTAAPYPVVDAGEKVTICYNTSIVLHGTHDGNTFTWSPASSLINANTLNPTAFPPRTTEYILTSLHTDPNTCPKPNHDTVLVTVLPKIRPYAGNDTLVIVGQPLQLNAEGGVDYLWIPATGLNNATIKNPIGTYGGEIDSVRYVVRVFNDAGCYDSATVKVTIFKTVPYVFVPSAFTPNGDGLNDLIRPIAVGIQKINYFRVFNRWGQMVFNTTTNGRGWDGRINGTVQTSNVFVWMVSAVDYLGKSLFLKGTFTLIR